MNIGTHCDDIIDDPKWPECLRNFLRFNRLPAMCKLSGRSGAELDKLTQWIPAEQRPYIWTDPEPVLFATAKERFTKTIGAQTTDIPAGTRVRVVMASRFGDVGITTNLKAAHGYDARVFAAQLTDFSETP